MQQSGYNDMQLFQLDMMFKQFLEFQRQQQQLHQLSDVRQQNSFNQLPNIAKQVGGQFSPLFNGTPIQDAPQVSRQWMQRGAPPLQNKVMSPHDQGRALHSLGLAPPQIDSSLYGTPISSTRSDMTQYPHLQGTSHDSVNLMPNSGGQAQKPIVQVSDFGNPYLGGDQSSVPSDLVSFSQKAMSSKLEFQVKNNVGHVPIQDLNGGVFAGNLQEGNAPHVNSSMKEFSEGQVQSGVYAMQKQQTTKQPGASQGLVPLDPIEAKILYNMDDNIWDTFGGRSDINGGGFGNALEQLDSSSTFPSIQSGSWSALMQSAVAETSGTDAGLQEEWSGLTFRNIDQSTDNQISNLVDSDKQHTSWADNNLQSASSFGSKYFPMMNDSNMTSDIPSLQHPEIRREEMSQTGVNEIFINMSDCHSSKGFNNAVTGSLSDFQGNARASEGVADRGDHGSNSSTFHGSVLHDGSNVTVQTSEHMLDLLHKVDQSRCDSTTRDFGTSDSNLLHEVPTSDSQDTSVAQPYTETLSHGIGLRLGLPSQRLPNGNNLFSPQDFAHTLSPVSSKQVNVETGEGRQTLLSPPTSYQSSQPSHEMSQKAQWNNRVSMGQEPFSSSLNVQQNDVASSTLNALYAANQLEAHPTSNVLAASQSLQAALPGGNRYLSLNQSSSQDSYKQIYGNSSSQQFPVLDTLSMSQPSVGMSQEGGNSARAMNVWRNVLNSRKTLIKEGSQRQLVSKILDISHFGAASQKPKQDSDATALTSGSSVSHSQQDDLNRVGHESNLDQASERNLEALGHPLNQYQHFPQLHQVQSTNNGADTVSETQQATALGGQMLSSRYMHPKDNDTGSAYYSAFSADTKMQKVSGDVEGDPSLKSPLQSVLQFGPSMVKVGNYDSQTVSSSTDVPSSHSNHGQILAPSWFKQYGTLTSGQIRPTFNAVLEKTGASQFFLEKSFQSLNNNTSEIQLTVADAVDGGGVSPNEAATFVGNQKVTAPFVSPLDVANQVSILKSKKRKIYELLPWNKEVTQDSMRLQNTSLAEENWASAANRLFEKVEDAIEIIEDTQPLPRAKRRIVMTRQLMQQLFCPPPASIFSADPTTNYDILSYSIARLLMGDACSLSYRQRNNLFVLNKNEMNVEKQENSEQTLEVLGKFIDRAKKLENEFQRLDKSASVVDIRVELLELERTSVINRFAKFHIRSQSDTSGTTSSSATLKPHPQRYVTAFSSKRNPHAGVQCLSL